MDSTPEALEQCCRTGWDDLSPELQHRIFRFLPRNEVACTVRLINKAALQLFPDVKAVKLSDPVPPQEFLWRWGRPDAVSGLTLKQRRQLLTLAARSGTLENLEVALAAAGCPLAADVCGAAAGAGHQHVCQWLMGKGCPGGLGTVAAAARGGHVALVRWLLQEGLEPGKRECAGFWAWEAAAGAGNRALCEALLAYGTPGDGRAPLATARAGHAALTEWLLQLPQLRAADPSNPDTDCHKREMLEAAAYGFDLAGLQRLHRTLQAAGEEEEVLEGEEQEGAAQDASLLGGGYIPAAALVGPTPDWREKVQWLRARGCAFDADSAVVSRYEEIASRPDCVERAEVLLSALQDEDDRDYCVARVAEAAVRAGNLALLRYVREGRRWLPEHMDHLFSRAAGAGDLGLLAELIALGWSISFGAAHEAAMEGHLHVLQWLEGPEAGLVGGAGALRRSMNPSLARCAAASGRVELVEWVLERGCRWDEQVFADAAEVGNSALLEALAARGCPMGHTGQAYVRAGANGDMLTLRCLRRLGCPWDPAGWTFNQAVSQTYENGHLYCSLEVLRWLLEEGCPVDWEAARRRAGYRRDSGAAAVRAWIESRLGDSEGALLEGVIGGMEDQEGDS